MPANRQTIAEARRLCATIQLELKAKTFYYAKRFPDSDRIMQREIETPEKIQPISVTELTDSWPKKRRAPRGFLAISRLYVEITDCVVEGAEFELSGDFLNGR